MRRIMMGLVVMLFTACSNKKDVILQNAGRPTLAFSKDTVTVREKDWTNVHATGSGNLTIYVSDASHELNMTIADTSSNVHLLYRGTEIQNGQSIPVMDSIQLYCVADVPGLYEIDIWMTDRLGRGDTKKLFVRCVPDSPPVATFFYRDLGSDQLQSWNYLFDASGTFKADGLITEYHYSINGQEIITNQPVMYWTFHAKGNHTIGLYVVDDLGQISATVYQTVTIQ